MPGVSVAFEEKLVELDGVTRTVAEWCKIHKLKTSTVYARAQRGTLKSQWFESVADSKKRRVPNGLFGPAQMCSQCKLKKAERCFDRGRSVCRLCASGSRDEDKLAVFIAARYV